MLPTAPHFTLRRALPLFLAAILSVSASQAFAAAPFKMRIPVGPIVVAAPTLSIPGYDPSTGLFQAAQGTFTYSNGEYVTTSGNLQAVLAVAPAADAAAIANMRANPAGVAGTLAEAWLAGQGLQYLNGQWQKEDTTNAGETYLGGWMWGNSQPENIPCNTDNRVCSVEDSLTSVAVWIYGPGSVAFNWSIISQGPSVTNVRYDIRMPNGQTSLGWNGNIVKGGLYVPPTSVAADPDFAALPAPTPAVGAELPYAPYMPQGVPVTPTTITDLSTGKTYTCTNGACG